MAKETEGKSQERRDSKPKIEVGKTWGENQNGRNRNEKERGMDKGKDEGKGRQEYTERGRHRKESFGIAEI